MLSVIGQYFFHIFAAEANKMKKILVIEDDEQIRENVAEILALSGYEAITAENGKKGIEKSLSQSPDLILCDITMPDLDGYGTLAILNKHPQTAGIPFIYLTAKAEKEDFRKGMSLGADDYIIKPFDDVTLLSTIEARLRKNELLKKASDAQNGSLDHFINEARALEALSHLPENCETRQYRKKDILFQEGDHLRWLFYIEKGKIKMFKTAEDGREFIMSISGPGEFVGYLTLLQDTRCTENAAVLEDVTVKLIPKTDFLSLVFSNRDVATLFIKMLAGHVSEHEQHLLQLAYHSVRKRVAAALVQVAGERNERIRMFREDLASIVGTAKETLVRTLADFKSEGLIEISEGYITLLKPERLRMMQN
jgi:CRP/FNR family cyclic AMP-dependent transcriptional regulator